MPHSPGETVTSLLSGREYLDTLRDDRHVYIYGERVADVTTHTAFRNSARSIARLYDALHDPAQRDVLTVVDREGLRTHRFFTSSYSAEELLAARDAIAHWSRFSYGFMGRTPDYKAAFMATLGSNPEFYAPYADNARAIALYESFGFEREGLYRAYAWRNGAYVDSLAMARLRL